MAAAGQVHPGSLAAAVGEARTRLRAIGIAPDEADLDARVLAQSALGWDAARLLASLPEPVPPGFVAGYRDLVSRRTAREPVAYITGHQEFWGLSFEVTPAVLIPRPETELIVEAALQLAANRDRVDTADVGTGTGCIAIALAHQLPAVHVVATDISPVALRVAARNARTHGVAHRIRFVAADLMAGVDGGFDLIVSNPPYIALADRVTLPPEVRDHEPAVALFGGADGLAVVRRLVGAAAAHLRPDGVLLFEFGMGQAEAVAALISGVAGLTLSEVRRDLQGIPRMAVVRKV